MKKPWSTFAKVVLAAGALALASHPISAQVISADTVKNGHFPEALRGHMDARLDKSIHYLSTTGFAAAAHAKAANPPQPIVSPFFRTSSRSGSVNYGFMVGPTPFSNDEGAKRAS